MIKLLRLILCIIFIIGFILPSFKCYAYNWNKSLINPVVSPINSPWIHIANPVLLDKENFLNLIIQVNDPYGWKISKAMSSNNGNTWTISNQVILPTGIWDIEHSNPAVIYNPSKKIYEMWFTGYSSSVVSGPDRFRVGYAYSQDGNNWSKYANDDSLWVLKGDTNSWDEGGITRGISVILIDGVYHMWYTATNTQFIGTFWRIGYATSNDGIHWKKYPKPVIEKTKEWEYENMMYPNVLYENGVFKMWYGTGAADSSTRYAFAESINGSEWSKPFDKNPVYTASGAINDFDKIALAGQIRIRNNNEYKILYSGYNGTRWSIGYATASADPLPPNPIPTPLEPVVIVPGMMSSWNKEGIAEGVDNPSTPWTLLPFVKEYEGLLKTLETMGYVYDKNLFIWPYDWRKPVQAIALQFDKFLTTKVKPKNKDSKLQLVGHSLGGLITRTWAETNTNSTQIHHLVNVASPQKGTIQPYLPWEGGDISREDNFLNLAGRIIIELNRSVFATPREAIQTQFPVLKDILPTDPFLQRKGNGTFIPIQDMSVQNTWLAGQNSKISVLFPIFDALYGVGYDQTPFGYTVVAPNWIDQILGNWKDGKPEATTVADGDMVVPSSRSYFSDDPAVFLPSHTHGDVIAGTEAIKQIVQTLEIPVPDSSIIPGKTTRLKPGLLFILRSPASLQVTFNDETFTETDGFIYIPDARDGTYTVSVTGTGPGTYRLIIGQNTPEKFVWNEYLGNTTLGLQKNYSILFRSDAPVNDPVVNLSDRDRIEDLCLRLTELSKLTNSMSVAKAQNNCRQAVLAIERSDYASVKTLFEQILQNLSFIRKAKSPINVFQRSFAISDAIVDMYHAILSKQNFQLDQKEYDRILKLMTQESKRVTAFLEKKSQKEKDIVQDILTYQKAEEYKMRAQAASGLEPAKRFILLFLAQIIYKEI